MKICEQALRLVILASLSSSCSVSDLSGSLSVLPSIRQCLANEFPGVIVPVRNPQVTHRAFDATIGPNGGEIGASFGYGHEPVRENATYHDALVYIDDCSQSLRLLGKTRTDSEGRTNVSITPSLARELGAGNYSVFFGLADEGQFVKSTLRLRAESSPMVVFDIDGTLTTSDGELLRNLFERILGGEYSPKERLKASEFANRLADAGFDLIYLTGRPDLLLPATRSWLASKSFPPATVFLASRHQDVVPNIQGVGRYKTEVLQDIQRSGFRLIAAYGNAKTDIYAYENSQISKSATFILGPHGGEKGTVALGKDFSAAQIPKL